ncbi:nuclease-related domain-containing protein [Psychrobacillus soli]|uniref:nuclease-related domain-containing protein n=1 Tax=Psychrobacillus soli TaxID=1543965 RepID=UPI001FEC7061|nr:nuclease-related domain-containing protein [Psychrobacillus soli]
MYKRLLHRISKNQSLYLEIEKKIRAIEAGYSGESYVDNFLKQVNFPKHYAILKDLHIQIDENNYLQIDTLILTKKYFAILEIKNIRGKIYFQRNPNQLIREIDGETTPLKCPEQQLKRHVQKLKLLLQQYKVNIPIKSLIVLAYSKTHVVLPPQYANITMGCDISHHIEEYNQLPDAISTQKFHQSLTNLLSRSNEFIPKPLAKVYPLELSHIKIGLFCPNCHVKINNQRNCINCNTPKKIMQQQAIEDWFYLVKDTISNSECVYFLELKDKFAANYLLNKMALHPVNHHKSRYYIMQKTKALSELQE